ncbi:CRP-like cAMP-activated global transcriptional regulator [Ferriphaselus amnicola]|uniref:CRP-like cAMP-activated global transcriptional regulator n=1 Tax=Ferriphaselus amnicola TaxID=1188319 RepID=A0A2Z6GDT2_9PROT|nr:Crp/Fnr family transcriptional regulator [Ferriphaselus amnicola]BBE51696.1 CRP-like cAMP-activated global transcriptional regulator [Ferriphaselus amnicola]
MLDTAIQIRLLAAYPMLRGLPANLLESLCNGAQLLRLPAGTVVFDEDQPCQGFPLLLAGNVRVIKASPNGRELQLYRVDPGESCILTSSCLMGHTRYQARGEVEKDVEMVVLSAPVFRQLISAFEPFRDYIFGLFSDRLTDMMQLVSAVAFQKLDQRLAALLLTKTSPLRATHQQLADELGSVREMVSRLLKQFADQGWVKLGREQIEITDAPGLKRYSLL